MIPGTDLERAERLWNLRYRWWLALVVSLAILTVVLVVLAAVRTLP